MAGRARSSVAAFVRGRRASWERLSGLSARIDSGRLALGEVEELDRLYRRAVGDLAYARAAFPGSDAAGYLSQVTARAYAALYRRRRARAGAARSFFLAEVPETFRRRAGLFGLAFAFLASGIAGGALAVLADPAAALSLVPAGVREAVAEGRMWTDSLVALAPGLEGSLIAHNNLTVSALAFALGLTGGIGTAWILFANGLLLGAVATHCAQHGMAAPFFSFVAAHGPAELVCLLIAGQSGLLVSRALVDPGEWPRSTALVRHAREAARLLAVVAPLLVVVGLVESTISPGDAFPGWLKAAFGLSLAAGLLAYLWRPGARVEGAETQAGRGAG